LEGFAISLLSITQALAVKFGIPSPGAAASSTDQNVQQIVAFINEDGQELASRGEWQFLRNEATFVTVATESQGSLQTICGPDFNFICNETFWNRSQRRPIFGPKTPAEWQQLKAQLMQGPWIQYIIRGNNILFLPIPAAGQNCFLEWCTKFWCTDLTGVTGKTAMTLDTDIAKLDERLLTLGAMWRFKKSKKLDWEGDFEKAEAAIEDSLSRDGAKVRINMAGQQTDIFPAILVPSGNWMT
jgi:hypothetical protein